MATYRFSGLLEDPEVLRGLRSLGFVIKRGQIRHQSLEWNGSNVMKGLLARALGFLDRERIHLVEFWSRRSGYPEKELVYLWIVEGADPASCYVLVEDRGGLERELSPLEESERRRHHSNFGWLLYKAADHAYRADALDDPDNVWVHSRAIAVNS